MSRPDCAALENVEFEACADLYRAAPDEVRRTHAIGVREIEGATCYTCRDLDPPAVFRRAAGLGVERSASERELDAVCAYMSEHTRGYAVTVAPESQPPALTSWLERREFTRGYAWMKFCRPCDRPPKTETHLEIRLVGAELAGEYGRITTEGFEMPSSVAPWIAALAGRANWICLMAFADRAPIAAGAVYVRGEYAWLGFGATLASHRRLGAQNALLARRLSQASARGARFAVTETGERVPDRPSNSYRNILRAGFEEMYVRQNYLSRLKA
jgi:hypothetical protein